jgi:hypothetical protein
MRARRRSDLHEIAEVLGMGVGAAEEAGTCLHDVLQKKRNTTTQTTNSGRKRRERRKGQREGLDG